MKITQVISDTNIGGAGVLLSSIAGELGGSFDFEVVIPNGSALAKRLPRNIKITELPVAKDKSFFRADVVTFYKYFKEKRPDIVHTHASLSARLGARLAGVGVCLSTRHCAKPESSVRRASPLKRAVYRFSTDLTVSTADFATSNLIAEGIENDSIITIKNGSPDLRKRLTGNEFSLHEQLSLSKETKIIGSSARLENVKGQDLILAAAPRVIKEFPDVRFVFLGEGSKAEEYRRTASKLGIENFVIFPGFVSEPELYERDFYINVNASRGTETSCLATSECMSLGVPTVASDFGGNKEMISDGENGLLFPSDNRFVLEETILKLLRDPALRERLSEGARRSYEENFSLSRMAEDYKRLYLSLLAAKEAELRRTPSRRVRKRA